jgi:PAS domain S-box-containing protein
MTASGNNWSEERARIIGLGETSARKSYYAELQKHIEELKASEADLRTLFNSTHDAIFIHDYEGRVVDVNESMLKLYRVTREEALRYTIADYSSAHDAAERLPAIMARAWEAGAGLVFEWEARRPGDGTQFPAEVAIRPVVWRKQRMAVALVRDITERLHAEKERRRLEDQLAQLRKMETLGQLAGGIAHDFNNMLTPIMSYAVMLRDDMPLEDPRRGDLEEIVRSSLRAKDLTRQLLTFSRMQPLALKRINLNQLITNFEKMLRRTLRENIVIQYALQSDLGWINGDVGQIEQVLLNLAVNAQDAMPDEGRLEIQTRNVTITDGGRTTPPGKYVTLIVTDTGHGMDEATVARIFEPFFTTKGLGRGTGLGLSTVYGIVRQHEAFIEVDSRPGEGTSFVIHFPGRFDTESPEPAPLEAREQRQATYSGAVLLVEDQEQVRKSIQTVLEHCGYEVICAQSASEALSRAAEGTAHFDLLITDVILEGINGHELYAQLLNGNPSLKALFISGYPLDVIGRHGSLDPNINFLAKPFTPDELIAAAAKARGSE